MNKAKMEYPKKKKDERQMRQVDPLQILDNGVKATPTQCAVKYKPGRKESV